MARDAARGRDALLSTAYTRASAADDDLPTRRVRGAWVASHIADGTSDDKLVDAATALADGETLRLADCRALTAGHMALKLAQLTADLLHEFDGCPQSVGRLVLCASTLADAVALSAGPIALPAGALAGVREGDLVTAAVWRARQEEAWRTHALAEVP